METGLKENTSYGKIISWKDHTELKWWGENGSSCNMINGSEAMTFNPKRLDKFNIYTFDPDACRSLKWGYHGKRTFGTTDIKAWNYVFTKDMLENPKKHKENSCFCVKPGEDGEDCYKDGIIDLSACRNGNTT